MSPDNEEPLTDYSEDGVDLTLIRWMLWLSPSERIQFIAQQREEKRPPQTPEQQLATLRRTMEESKKAPFWPQTPQQ